MGIYISSYAIRTEDLKKAIGSNDNHLYEDVLKVLDDLSRGNFESNSTEVAIKSALQDLIFNQPLYNHSADLYWYAFEALCSYFGKELHYDDFKVGYVTDIVDNIFKSDFGLDINICETMINLDCDFFELPDDKESDVLSGFLNRNDLFALQSKFKKIQITDDLLETSLDEEAEDKAIGYCLIKEIKEHISYCVEGGFDLVSFSY